MAGVNERTIRRAIAAGHLPATKQRGAFRISPADLAAWRVAYEAEQLPDRPATTGQDRATTGQSGESVMAAEGSSGHLSGTDGATAAELWRALEEEGKATAAAKDETISRLDAEVAFLREQLDQRSRELAAERERFDVIQQLALQRIEALTATVAERREDVPEAAPGPPGRAEAVGEGARVSWLASAWRKLAGGG